MGPHIAKAHRKSPPWWDTFLVTGEGRIRHEAELCRVDERRGSYRAQSGRNGRQCMATEASQRTSPTDISVLLRRDVGQFLRGTVDVQGEKVDYELYALDARSDRQRKQDSQRGKPGGNIMVVVPGHGQGVRGPKKLLAHAALLSKSKMAWCIDPTPSRGGDRTEAQAIARIARERMLTAFPGAEEPIAATLIGFSHGGGEALRAADGDPELFPQYLGLCPSGLVDRKPLELLFSFALEAARILWASARSRDWECLKDTVRLGWNAAVGLLRDLWRTKSPRRLVDDIGWAAAKVPGRGFTFSGEVVLVFGAQDTVIRWQSAFPGCVRPEEISACRAAFQTDNFPSAARLEVQVIEGAHVAPEARAPAFLQAGLSVLGQLDEGKSADTQSREESSA